MLLETKMDSFEAQIRFLLPLFRNGGSDGYYTYIEYVYNKWVVLLLVAAILEVYATFRIGNEMGREDGEKGR